jgi:chloramphenicol O-acetyltransferase type A
MQIIDLTTWERTTHFLAAVKARKLPFYYAMIFAAAHALNQVQDFRYRIRGDSVVLHETVHPSFTDMSVGSELFKMVTVDMQAGIEDFVAVAKQKAENQAEYFVRKDVEGRDDLIYITCIPWVSFTNLSHTISFNKDDSVPRLAWGKYFAENAKVLLPFSVQAHHSFVDGIHMGKFFDGLQMYLDAF